MHHIIHDVSLFIVKNQLFAEIIELQAMHITPLHAKVTNDGIERAQKIMVESACDRRESY